jgi:hypothetical protein
MRRKPAIAAADGVLEVKGPDSWKVIGERSSQHVEEPVASAGFTDSVS